MPTELSAVLGIFHVQHLGCCQLYNVTLLNPSLPFAVIGDRVTVVHLKAFHQMTLALNFADSVSTDGNRDINNWWLWKQLRWTVLKLDKELVTHNDRGVDGVPKGKDHQTAPQPKKSLF